MTYFLTGVVFLILGLMLGGLGLWLVLWLALPRCGFPFGDCRKRHGHRGDHSYAR